jgi:hypothetical protein
MLTASSDRGSNQQGICEACHLHGILYANVDREFRLPGATPASVIKEMIVFTPVHTDAFRTDNAGL